MNEFHPAERSFAMGTVLEQYQQKREDYRSQIEAHGFILEELMNLQEVNYRICVLETFQSMMRVIPVTTDLQVIVKHFQVVYFYMELLLKERKFGPKLDETQRQKRDTALASLENVVRDGKKRFMSFTAPNPDSYKKCIGKYCNAVLPMWMQYRETYIRLQGGQGL